MNRRRGAQSSRPWYLYLLGLVTVAVIAVGISELGTPASAARTSKEVVTAENGVVQTSVSGTGNVEPTVDDDVNFATSGTLQSVAVKVGQHVNKGQLIATLDPSSAQLTLDQAQATLTAAEDQLTEVQDGDSTSSGSSSGGDEASAASADATAASAVITEAVAHDDTGTTTTNTGTTPTGTTTTGTTTAATTTGTTTTATSTTQNGGSGSKGKSGGSTKSAGSGKSKSADSSADKTAANTTTTTKSTPSPAEIAQAQAQVDSDEATVTTDQKDVTDTKLYAPVSGTVASLSSDAIGSEVSSSEGSGSDASSSADSGSGLGSSSTTSGSSDSSSTGFATIINSKTLTMTVSLSESDISSVKVGQAATVTMSALSGVELAAKVTSISPLGSESDDVVSYDVTVTTTQSNPKVLPGMSATSEIITGQAQGVTIPTEALSGDTVQLYKGGKTTTQDVTVGLRGTSRAVITSGLKAGQQLQITVTLPALGTSTASSSSSTSGFTSRFGGGAGGGGGFRALFGGGGGGVQ